MAMDSTLLGALIGAGAAIAGGMLTTAWTNHSSKSREEFMLRNEKREQLYMEYCEVRQATYNFITIFDGRRFTLRDIEEIDEKFNSAIAKINMINRIYFNELLKPHRITISKFSDFFNEHISPLCDSLESEDNLIKLASEMKVNAHKAYEIATHAIDAMLTKVQNMKI